MATWPASGDLNWNAAMLTYLAVEHNTDGTHKDLTYENLVVDDIKTKSPWVDVTHPDFGAVGDGATDDSAAVKSAITDLSSGGVLYFPDGTYILEDIALNSKILVRGNGRSTILKLKANTSSDLLYATSKSDITISNLAIDMNTANQGTVAYPTTIRGLYFNGCSRIRIYNCWFYNLFEESIFIYNTSYVWIDSNHFVGSTSSQLHVGHINFLTADNLFITNNMLINPAPASAAVGVHGIYLSGVDNAYIVGNQLNYCGRDNSGGHRVAAIDLYADTDEVIIEDNILKNCPHRGVRIQSAENVVFSENYVKATSHEALLVIGTAADRTKNIQICTNTLIGNTSSDAVVNLVGEDVSNGELQDIRIKGNKIGDGYYGILGVRIDGLTIEGNKFQTQASCIRLEEGNTAPLSNVIICNNIIDASGIASADAIWVKGDTVDISHNIIRDAYRGIQTQISSDGQIIENIIEASSLHLYIRNNCTELFVSKNRYTGSGSITTDEGANTIWEYFASIGTLANDATPSVAGGDLWLTGGTITITDLDDGYAGQPITIIGAHSTTQLTDGGNLMLAGNCVLDIGDTISLVFDGTNWHEKSRVDVA